MEAKDKKECELTQPANFEWIRALDAQGNSIRISKTDLIKVVEELTALNGIIRRNVSLSPEESVDIPRKYYGLLLVSNRSSLTLGVATIGFDPTRCNIVTCYGADFLSLGEKEGYELAIIPNGEASTFSLKNKKSRSINLQITYIPMGV